MLCFNFIFLNVIIMTIENGDLVKYKKDGLVMYVDDASNPKRIRCRKSYEDERPDENYVIDSENLRIVEKLTKLNLYRTD